LAETISLETGKPLWESATEMESMAGKIAVSLEAYEVRAGTRTGNAAEARSVTRHKPHGVLAVFGPYNFPGHLPNGHIVPALLAGNTILFKASRYTPLVSLDTVKLWEEAGLPKGVLNLVQGTGGLGQSLAGHTGLAGLCFTGSSLVGRQLHQQFAGEPQKILALEMGGNNPLIIAEPFDSKAALYFTLLSAYLTAGQRCTCARRLFVPEGRAGNAFINDLCQAVKAVRVGLYNESPPPFMGPVITEAVANALLRVQKQLAGEKGIPLVPMEKLKPKTGLLTPGLMDVSAIKNLPDEEYFGPFLQVIRYLHIDQAIAKANHTRYGLAAGLLCNDTKIYQRFYTHIRAGIVNWNRPLTGASSRAPFGGIGISGNHRPSAYYAADYCAYPVASLEAERLVLPSQLSPGITL